MACWRLYIVKCADKTLYTGITNNLKQRIKAHNSGKGAKYTRGRRPVKLVYSKKVKTRGRALRDEYRVKKLKRSAKLSLIQKRV